jgi:hypothetical protein
MRRDETACNVRPFSFGSNCFARRVVSVLASHMDQADSSPRARQKALLVYPYSFPYPAPMCPYIKKGQALALLPSQGPRQTTEPYPPKL